MSAMTGEQDHEEENSAKEWLYLLFFGSPSCTASTTILWNQNALMRLNDRGASPCFVITKNCTSRNTIRRKKGLGSWRKRTTSRRRISWVLQWKQDWHPNKSLKPSISFQSCSIWVVELGFPFLENQVVLRPKFQQRLLLHFRRFNWDLLAVLSRFFRVFARRRYS